MKRFFIAILLFPCVLCAAPLKVPVEASGAILINGENGTLLFEKNGGAEFYPASITKIATALYVLKKAHGRLNEKITAEAEALASISPEAKRQSKYRAPAYFLESDGSHIGIKKGEEFLLIDLLHAVLMRSANDACNVLAQHYGGTIPHFMDELNGYLKEIGCTKTHFLNPHGLHHPDHVTTPRDMAIMAREAMKDPTFRKIVSEVHYTIPETNLQPERPLLQTNLFLRSGPNFYPKAIGIKTGTSIAAGKTLVGAAEEKGGRMLIAVVMGYQGKGDRYDDMKRLFEAAFKEPKKHDCVLPEGIQKASFSLPHATSDLKVYLEKPLEVEYYPSEKRPVKVKMKWQKREPLIQKGECVGKMIAIDTLGSVLNEVDVYAAEEVKPTLFYRIRQLFSFDAKRFIFVGSTLLVSGFFFLMFLKRRKKRSASTL